MSPRAYVRAGQPADAAATLAELARRQDAPVGLCWDALLHALKAADPQAGGAGEHGQQQAAGGGGNGPMWVKELWAALQALQVGCLAALPALCT